MDREAAVDPAGDDGTVFELGAEASRDGQPQLVVHCVPRLAGEHWSRSLPVCCCGLAELDGPAETAGPSSLARGPECPSDRPLVAGSGSRATAGRCPTCSPLPTIPHFAPLAATIASRSDSSMPFSRSGIAVHGGQPNWSPRPA